MTGQGAWLGLDGGGTLFVLTGNGISGQGRQELRTEAMDCLLGNCRDWRRSMTAFNLS